MKLSDRLETILSFSDGEVLADIGTDHGFIPIEAVRRGIVKKAIAGDVKKGPLMRAAGHIEEAGLCDSIKTVLADGLAGIEPGEADVITVTGMGGGLIIRILENGMKVAASAKKLILSPQSELMQFRKYITENGYRINREACVLEDGKYYFIIEAEPGTDSKLTPSELAYGKAGLFDEKSRETRARLIKKDIETYSDILAGLPEKSIARRNELIELSDIAKGAIL